MKLLILIFIVCMTLSIGYGKDDTAKIKSSKETGANNKMKISESSNYIKMAEELANAHWGKGGAKEIHALNEYSYVKYVKPLVTDEINKLLSDNKVFGLEVYNPVSQIKGRSYFHYSLIINTVDDSVFYLENDEQVIKFLSGLSLKVNNKETVNSILKIFELLLGYKYCNEPVEGLHFNWGYEQFTNKDWELSIKEVKNKWEILITYLVDPYIYAYRRYQFNISKNGHIRINLIKRASIGGYQ